MTTHARILSQNDYPAYDAFLEPYTAEAYFLRSNARMAGLDWHEQDFQGQYIGVFKGDTLTAVLSYTWINTINACAPDPSCLQVAIPLLRDLIKARGGALKGFAMLKPEADFLIPALNIPAPAFCLDKQEGFYVLDLTNWVPPYKAEGSLSARLALPQDREILIPWRVIFNIEQLGETDSEALLARVTKEIDQRTKASELYVLEDKESSKLFSFYGIMGAIPTHLHIGPVFTIHQHRGKGYARLLLSETIAQLKSESAGVLKTIGLFTADPAAIKVYESLGFQRVNDYQLTLCHDDFRF